MITQIPKPAMTAVTQPSRHLARDYWNKLELDLLAAMSSAAVARQAAQSKGRAL